jgi:hypothetical protein
MSDTGQKTMVITPIFSTSSIIAEINSCEIISITKEKLNELERLKESIPTHTYIFIISSSINSTL